LWQRRDGCCRCGFLLLLAGSGKITMNIGVVEIGVIVCGGGLLLVAVVAGLYFWQQRER